MLLICVLCTIFCAFSQTEYPIIEKGGKKYYEYTINPGEGLFAIARKFGIKQNDLHDANENLSTNIKVGEKILIPIKTNESSETLEAMTTHVVEAKQTLYSISKIYNVSVNTLIDLNPSAKTGIKTGEVLIISKDKKIEIEHVTPKVIQERVVSTNSITHIVQKKETLYSISKKYNIAIHDLIALNPELKDGLKAGAEILIKGERIETKEDNNTQSPAIVDTTTITKTIETTEPQDTIVVRPQISNTNTINIAYLLPLIAENTNDEKNIQRFVEFYRGSILALNEAKENGMSANIYTYNLPKDTNKIDSILFSLTNKNIEVIIGPAYSEQLNKILTFSKENNITTIVPFSNKIDSTYYFPKLIQFNPPQDSLFKFIIRNTFEHRNLQYILARFENCTNKGNIFANDLSTLLTENNKEFKELIIKPEYVDSLVNTISKTDTTVLLLASAKINDVAGVLDSLNRYQLPNLQVWGFEDWGTNLIKKYPQTLYYSLFYPNETEKYKTNYKNWFGTRKQTVGVKYDLLGYDLTLLVLKGITYFEDSTLNINTKEINFLQSTPQLEFIDNRWLNMNYYLLFWDNITIKNISDKE